MTRFRGLVHDGVDYVEVEIEVDTEAFAEAIGGAREALRGLSIGAVGARTSLEDLNRQWARSEYRDRFGPDVREVYAALLDGKGWVDGERA